MKDKYKKNRFCKLCGKTLYYGSGNAYRSAERVQSNCRSCAVKMYSIKKNCARVLNSGTIESFYWLGFILADGHISDIFRLKVTLGMKDRLHLEKLGKFLCTKVFEIKKSTECTLSLMDKTEISNFVTKFDIHPTKTVNPPNLSIYENLTDEQFLSVVAGFIDGDGSIKNLNKRKDFKLTIKVHGTWLGFLTLIRNRLFPNVGSVKINNQGYALLYCGNVKIIKDLKRKVIEFKIPFMERKWSVIDLNYISKVEKSNEDLLKVKSLIKEGKTTKEISQLTGLSYSGIYKKIKNQINNDKTRLSEG